jgi:hypothetical protein
MKLLFGSLFLLLLVTACASDFSACESSCWDHDANALAMRQEGCNDEYGENCAEWGTHTTAQVQQYCYERCLE